MKRENYIIPELEQQFHGDEFSEQATLVALDLCLYRKQLPEKTLLAKTQNTTGSEVTFDELFTALEELKENLISL